MNNLKNGLTNLNSSGGNINAFNLPTQDQYNSVLNALKGAINVSNTNKSNNITPDNNNNSVTILPNNTLSSDVLSTNTNNNIDTTTITSSPYLYMGLFLILVYFIIKK